VKVAYSPQDAQAIRGLAGRLGVSPGTLTGLFELESGGDPNIWGGAGGKYRGLIQFGPGARQEVGLPSSPMTVSEQLPYVEKYFQQRGFTPGKHGARELYRTVLVGNPHQSGTDSWGTNSDKAAARMLPGGDLYERGSAKLGGGPAVAGAPGAQPTMSGYEPMQFAGSNPAALAAAATMGMNSLTAPSGLSPAGNPLVSAAMGVLGMPDEPMAMPRRSSGQPALGGIAENAIQSILAQSPQFGQPAPVASGGMPSGMPGGGGLPAASGDQVSILDFGRQLSATGLKLTENPHPELGGSVSPVHSQNSFHDKTITMPNGEKVGLAFEMVDWRRPKEPNWLERKKIMDQEMTGVANQYPGAFQVLGPYSDPAGHPTHIHFEAPSGYIPRSAAMKLLQAEARARQRVPLAG
jgi:hypothetical protein